MLSAAAKKLDFAKKTIVEEDTAVTVVGVGRIYRDTVNEYTG